MRSYAEACWSDCQRCRVPKQGDLSNPLGWRLASRRSGAANSFSGALIAVETYWVYAH
jgi:hypothetical protein